MSPGSRSRASVAVLAISVIFRRGSLGDPEEVFVVRDQDEQHVSTCAAASRRGSPTYLWTASARCARVTVAMAQIPSAPGHHDRRGGHRAKCRTPAPHYRSPVVPRPCAVGNEGLAGAGAAGPRRHKIPPPLTQGGLALRLAFAPHGAVGSAGREGWRTRARAAGPRAREHRSGGPDGRAQPRGTPPQPPAS